MIPPEARGDKFAPQERCGVQAERHARTPEVHVEAPERRRDQAVFAECGDVYEQQKSDISGKSVATIRLSRSNGERMRQSALAPQKQASSMTPK